MYKISYIRGVKLIQEDATENFRKLSFIILRLLRNIRTEEATILKNFNVDTNYYVIDNIKYTIDNIKLIIKVLIKRYVKTI